MTHIAIVDGCRTPFAKAGTSLAKLSFLDLGSTVVESLVNKLKIDPKEIHELSYSTVLLDPRTPNAARELVFKANLPKTIPAHFVSNNCISGLVSVNLIREGILSGRIENGIAGGAESMSRPSLTLSYKAEKFFLSLFYSRTTSQKIKTLLAFKPSSLLPQPPSPKEPSTGLTMGEHCEIMAKEFQIPREEQDLWALESHKKASKAQLNGNLNEEIAPVNGIKKDNIIRADTSLEKLSKLPPVFDKTEKGTLTAGNSSPLTDGASAVFLTSKKWAKEHDLTPLGFIKDMVFSAINPKDGLLMAPVVALPTLLKRNKLTVDDVDIFEIHEAFSAQVLANLKLWKEGWTNKYREATPIGEIPKEKINPQGGSIAIGHPFAATGGRLIISLCRQLQQKNLKRGIISVCAAGAMACAVLIETE